MNYRDFLQKVIYHVIDPFINLYAMCFFLDAAMAFEEGTSDPYILICLGGIIILVAGLFDMMDGRLARMGNMSSTFGALWDSTLDRYSELVTLFAICLIFIKAGWFWMGVTTFAAMIGSIMVSYVRARAEGLNIECKVGLMQRPERVVVTAVVAIISGCVSDLWWLAGGMILIAVLANITAFWRIIHCYKVLNGK